MTAKGRGRVVRRLVSGPPRSSSEQQHSRAAWWAESALSVSERPSRLAAQTSPVNRQARHRRPDRREFTDTTPATRTHNAVKPGPAKKSAHRQGCEDGTRQEGGREKGHRRRRPPTAKKAPAKKAIAKARSSRPPKAPANKAEKGARQEGPKKSPAKKVTKKSPADKARPRRSRRSRPPKRRRPRRPARKPLRAAGAEASARGRPARQPPKKSSGQ